MWVQPLGLHCKAKENKTFKVEQGSIILKLEARGNIVF